MTTLITTVTDRGQVSIPAEVRRQLGLEPGQRLSWEVVGEGECVIRIAPTRHVPGAVAMLGYARTFRKTRRTSEWMADLREGDADGVGR
ncbi:MAG: AbrB/MazE/SpoVT family DNA-binding domain-containing protein [Vicinamibacterales bacterium]|nr:AbrB/MazE/SpoVT family DNA-binding domain-containing protein [Vicinamibacterales bacterium]